MPLLSNKRTTLLLSIHYEHTNTYTPNFITIISVHNSYNTIHNQSLQVAQPDEVHLFVCFFPLTDSIQHPIIFYLAM